MSRPWVSVQEALERINQADAGRPRRRFLILGAGMAGLAAAYELHRRGHQVEILEGSPRAGGRVDTRRFENGSYAERGAMRIPLCHDYTHHYIRMAGLSEADLRRFWNSTNTGRIDVRDTVAREREFVSRILPLFPGLSPAERECARTRGAGGLLELYMAPLMATLTLPARRDLLSGAFVDNPLLQPLDRVSWHQYLRQSRQATPDGLALVGSVLSLRAVWDWSLAAILRDEIHMQDPDHPEQNGVLCEIRGGMDRLPQGLAARLPGDMIRYHQKVLDIQAWPGGGGVVLVEDTQTGEPQEKPFERLLCTLPFPVLRRMGLNTFSPEKRSAIKGLRYAPATKVLFNYDDRWWENAGIRGGRSVSDQPDGKVLVPRQVYYPSDSVPEHCAAPLGGEGEGVELTSADGVRLHNLFSLHTGESPGAEDALAGAPELAAAEARSGSLLGSYALNDGARVADQDRETVLRGLQRLHGPIVRSFRDSETRCWEVFPWSLGAFAITPPQDLLSYFREAKREQGTVYFAGEHVSIAPGWIQGALESSLREVARMLEKA